MAKVELRRDRVNRTISDPMIFAKRLGSVLRETGITKNAIEEDGIISRESLHYYLKGEKMPGARILQSLCSYMGVSADYLLGLSNSKEVARSWIFTNGMWCCPYCDEAGEPDNRFCPNCGRRIGIE